MTTSKQDNAFIELMSEDAEVILSPSALDSAVAWIADNLVPDEVFSTTQLEAWAESNGYSKEGA